MEVVITRRLANGVVLNAESGDARFSWFACEPDVVIVRGCGIKVYCQGLAPRRIGSSDSTAQTLPDEKTRQARDFHEMLMPIVQASWKRHVKTLQKEERATGIANIGFVMT